MNPAAFFHRPTEEFVYPVDTKRLSFRFQGARGDLKTCTLVFWRRDAEPSGRQRAAMECVLRDREHDYFSARVSFPDTACYIRYCFELCDGRGTVWFGAQGAQDGFPGNAFFEYLYPNPADGYPAPEWAGSQIYYQIFPERFRDGDPANTPPGAVPWGSLPTRENHMGGNLKGVLGGLDYLSGLGITCIYLTPVFHGSSNHKYDTVDYFSVDPQFGTEEDLKLLVESCHERGIRVLLDGVFNHCGYYFPAFQDLLKNGERSRYRDWFLPSSLPLETDPPNYECVGRFKWMPKLNLANAETRDYLIGVGKYWIRRCRIDGWRLDVADEVEGRFWEKFSREIKEEFPDTVLIGEAWGDAGRLVLGNRLDSAMNYLFKDAVTDWAARGAISTPEFDHRINRMLALYPEEIRLRMYNPLDSHDTPRFLYECAGDKRKLRLAAAFMMVFPGCPAVFYGDEIGLTGANDPDCRRAMLWDRDQQDLSLLEWYRKLIRLRKGSLPLISGSYRTNLCGEGAGPYGFIRSFGPENVYVVLNPSDRSLSVSLPTLEEEGTELEEILEQTPARSEKLADAEAGYNHDIAKYRSTVDLTLPPYSVKILKKKVV